MHFSAAIVNGKEWSTKFGKVLEPFQLQWGNNANEAQSENEMKNKVEQKLHTKTVWNEGDACFQFSLFWLQFVPCLTILEINKNECFVLTMHVLQISWKRLFPACHNINATIKAGIWTGLMLWSGCSKSFMCCLQVYQRFQHLLCAGLHFCHSCLLFVKLFCIR